MREGIAYDLLFTSREFPSLQCGNAENVVLYKIKLVDTKGNQYIKESVSITDSLEIIFTPKDKVGKIKQFINSFLKK